MYNAKQVEQIKYIAKHGCDDSTNNHICPNCIMRDIGFEGATQPTCQKIAKLILSTLDTIPVSRVKEVLDKAYNKAKDEYNVINKIYYSFGRFLLKELKAELLPQPKPEQTYKVGDKIKIQGKQHQIVRIDNNKIMIVPLELDDIKYEILSIRPKDIKAITKSELDSYIGGDWELVV